MVIKIVLGSFIVIFILRSFNGNSHGVIAKVLYSGIRVREFESQSCYYSQYMINTLGKTAYYCIFNKDGHGIKSPTNKKPSENFSNNISQSFSYKCFF